MSRAFVREDDQVRPEAPPELKVSNLPNRVTPAGLKLIDDRLDELEKALAAAPDDHDAAWIRRELRYWSQQRASAQPVAPLAANADEVAFGARVAFSRDGGPREVVDIVGEDEADPQAGRIGWASPLARALDGAAVGDVVSLGEREIEVLAIEPIPVD